MIESDTYELAIEILDPAYLDQLIVSLARQGYAPYMNDDSKPTTVHITVYATDLTAINYKKQKV
jgi:hypothetical protein